jgi:tRNA uridine 5-carbamoylmethylation protein Kti12
MNKTVIILRGIPGSGKSTVAKLIQSLGWLNQIRICSADDYFIDRQTNEYKWNPRLLGEAHEYCKQNFVKAIRNEIDIIIVDNTNIKHKDFCFYKEVARQNNYKTIVLTVGGNSKKEIKDSFYRNQHNVPEEKIEQMALNFEL